MDGRSESAGESRSRVLMYEARLPKPDLQRVVCGLTGEEIGRVDFYFDEFATIGEFDGLGKYTKFATPRRPTADILVQEKLREDELRATGRSMARWTWAHLDTPDVVVAQLKRAFALGGRSQGAQATSRTV